MSGATGKIGVLLTGSTGGIGTTLAAAFMEHGYCVIGIDNREPSHRNTDAFVRCDLGRLSESHSEREKLENQIAACLEKHQSSVGVLINNAATQMLGSFEELALVDFNRSLAVNVIAPFVLAQMFLSLLGESKGRIINIGSIHARQTKPQFAAYATSKAALLGLTQAMAVELSDRVTVNIIQPAAIDTEMLRAGFQSNPEGLKILQSYHPIGRIGNPKEVAEVALLLASGKVDFLNGSAIDLHGGIGIRLNDPA